MPWSSKFVDGFLYTMLWLFLFVNLLLSIARGQIPSDENLHILSERGYQVAVTGQKHVVYCVGREPGVSTAQVLQVCVMAYYEHLVREMEWIDLAGAVVERGGPGRRVHADSTPDHLVLMIEDPQLADNGTWVCRAGDMQRRIQIYVVEEARFEGVTDVVTPLEGGEVTLTCAARGVPPPRLSWYRHGELMTAERSPAKYVVWEGKLSIHGVARADGGEYECRARQRSAVWQHDAVAVMRVLVRHAPILEGGPTKELYVLYDHSHVLRCSALAFPKPSYRWSHFTSGWKRIPDYGGDIFTARNGSYSELTVRVNGMDDLGRYKCTATNALGSDQLEFALQKGTKPEPPSAVVFKSATNDSLLFDIECARCELPTNNKTTPKSVIGYRFELMEQDKKGMYAALEPVYWEEQRGRVLAIDAVRWPNETTNAVRGLRRDTTFVARVASFNAAGPSDFLELDEQFTTAGACARLPTSLPLVSLLGTWILLLNIRMETIIQSCYNCFAAFS